MFRVLCSSELWLSNLLFFKGILGLGLGLVAQTDTLVLPLVSCWMNQKDGEAAETCFPSALPLPCAWHSSLCQCPPPHLLGREWGWSLALLPGLVPHPQKARARTDQTQIAVEVAPGWTVPVLGQGLALGSPGAASVLPVPSELRETWCSVNAALSWWQMMEKHRPRSSAVFSLLLWLRKLFCYCSLQKEWFWCFRLVQLHSPVSVCYDNSS